MLKKYQLLTLIFFSYIHIRPADTRVEQSLASMSIADIFRSKGYSLPEPPKSPSPQNLEPERPVNRLSIIPRRKRQERVQPVATIEREPDAIIAKAKAQTGITEDKGSDSDDDSYDMITDADAAKAQVAELKQQQAISSNTSFYGGLAVTLATEGTAVFLAATSLPATAIAAIAATGGTAVWFMTSQGLKEYWVNQHLEISSKTDHALKFLRDQLPRRMAIPHPVSKKREK